MTPKPLTLKPAEIPLILDGRCSALIRPLRRQPQDHHWQSLPGYKQYLNVLDTTKGLVAKFHDSYSFETRQGKKSQGSEPNISDLSPFGAPGYVLYCKESFVYRWKHDRYYYKADHMEPYTDPYAHDGWKSPILMPKSASRLWLKVKEVRVVRVQEVTEEMAKRLSWKEYFLGKYHLKAADAFAGYWIEEHGEDSWNGNPFCWYCEFEKIDKPDDV